MATLRELSDHTGYSPATISRILTGDPSLSVTVEARQKVLEEAGRLNYAATRSRRGRTPKCLLRLGVAEMLTPLERLGDPYYLYLSECVEEACRKNHFACLPLERRGDAFVPPEGPELDGVVAIGIFSRDQIARLRELAACRVFLDSSPDELDSDSVVLNYRLGLDQALDHLFSLGHRDVGFIGPAQKLNDWKEPAPEERRRLFLELMGRRGRENPTLIEAPMESAATAEAVERFLGTGRALPTALLAANEENALGAARALRGAGLRIPEDVSLLSFNDTPLSELAEPPLTSVSAQLREMARTAVRLLAQRAKGERTLPQKVVVPPTLTLRKSVAPPTGKDEEER